MKTLTTWNPWTVGPENTAGILSELDSIERRLESLVSRSLRGGDQSSWESFPPVDIHETDKEFILQADLPQLEKSDVKVSGREGFLEISGEKRTQREQFSPHCFRRERAFGAFQRAFSLPASADVARAKARMREGVLTISIPKNPNAEATAVQIELS
jgi:HSP20 family protein